MMERKKFRSRISVALIVVMLSVSVPIIYAEIYIVACIYGILIAFCLVSLRCIYYVLTDSAIEVYYLGRFRGKFFISVITSVERTYNMLDAPAASAKRLRFSFRRGYKWDKFFSHSPFFMIFQPAISPAREREFLEALKTLNPNIQINVSDKKGWWRFWDWDI